MSTAAALRAEPGPLFVVKHVIRLWASAQRNTPRLPLGKFVNARECSSPRYELDPVTVDSQLSAYSECVEEPVKTVAVFRGFEVWSLVVRRAAPALVPVPEVATTC